MSEARLQIRWIALIGKILDRVKGMHRNQLFFFWKLQCKFWALTISVYCFLFGSS